LTSQIFANIYMNKLDQFVKHELKVKNYLRYTDDFVLVHKNRTYLESLLPSIRTFLREHLRLELHPQKVSLRTFHQGIDFLGYVLRPHHRTVRTKTRRRIVRKTADKVAGYQAGHITEEQLFGALRSYLVVLGHANGYMLAKRMVADMWSELRKERRGESTTSDVRGRSGSFCRR